MENERRVVGTFTACYYLQATQKDPDTDVGPAKVDEYNYLYGDADWNPLPLVVAAGEKLNLGSLNTAPVPVKWQQFDKDITAIEGVVSGLDGSPVPGVMVFA